MRSDVIVIGGGLTGCATTYFLSRAGAGVTLLERYGLNTQASGNNAGSIHAQIPHEPFVTKGEAWARSFAAAIPLMMESIGLWADLQAELGVDLELATPGGVIVADSDAGMREIEAKAKIERAQGLPVDILDRADLKRMTPYISDAMIGGAFCPIEGKANPLAATPALAAAAARAGADIRTQVQVQGIASGSDGFTLETTVGPMRARRIVNCAGADAGDLAGMIGLDLPIERHPIQVSVTAPVAPLIKHLVYFAGGKLSLKQTPRGALLIGGGWSSRLDPATQRLSVDPQSVRANLAVACKVAPQVGQAALLRTWPAIVNGTDDWKPIIGEVPRTPGFFLAMFPWMGFTAGPIVAKIVADLVLGRKTGRDLSLFSLDRWAT